MKNITTGFDQISQINTHWTEINAAHAATDDGSASAAQAAKENVVARYGDCIYRYLLGATRNADVAEELTQEFAFRFVRGDFRNANPNKGRFRDYLKTALRNLVNDHFRQQQKTAAVSIDGHEYPADLHPQDELEQVFTDRWRQALIAQAWEGLTALELRHSNSYFTVLKFRSEHPELNSTESALALSHQLGETVTADWYRQKLHRARKKFGTFLLDAVKQTLPVDTPAAVESELAELRLLKYLEFRSST